MKGCPSIDEWPFLMLMENIQSNIIEEKVDYSFKKEERLCSKKIIEKLFSEGKSFLVFPLKVVYSEVELSTKFPAQVAFTVSKKKFKKAVQRNSIKRKIREAYRLNKNFLYANIGKKQIAVFFVFIAKELPDYKLIETAMVKSLKKLVNKVGSSD